jgi:hypothetical protein
MEGILPLWHSQPKLKGFDLNRQDYNAKARQYQVFPM